MNSENYLEFLRDRLPHLLTQEERENIFFQHDGAPAHTARIVVHFLNETFPHRWIGQGGPITWPARSPDLNPLNFFLWGTIKDIVYRTEVRDEEDLHERINGAFESVTPEMIEAMKANYIRRLRCCIRCEGGHFEQLL